MPRLADGFVSDLKDRIDLYDLVSRYVQLKKSGSSWVGLSPFNQEKTPSFYVHPQKGFF
jgi:DNA primase